MRNMAMKAIAAAEGQRAEIYPENPDTVYATLYATGYEVAQAIEGLGPGPVYSN